LGSHPGEPEAAVRREHLRQLFFGKTREVICRVIRCRKGSRLANLAQHLAQQKRLELGAGVFQLVLSGVGPAWGGKEGRKAS
jgi:hypothetical protein